MITAKETASSPTLRKALGGREYFTLAFGTMVGVGWMVVIDDWLTRGGAAGAMLGFLIGGLVLIPIGYVYGRLTERIPDAGSEIAYTAEVFPEIISFGTGWMMTLAYLIVCPYEAVAIGRVGSYVLPQLNTSGTPAIAHKFARDQGELDFLAITEHNHGSVTPKERTDGE